jgi:hypothetical protein
MRTAPLVLALLAGCAGSTTGGTDETATPEFCSTLADGGLIETADGGGNASSGLISIRVLTDESTDPKDPLYVAFKNYAFENLDGGGVKTVGQTSGDGLADELLGAGSWRFSAVYSRGSLLCVAEIDVVAEPDKTTYGCPVMRCP